MSTRPRFAVPPYQPTTITPTNGYSWPGPGFLVILSWGQYLVTAVSAPLQLSIQNAAGQTKTVLYYQAETTAYDTVATTKGIMNPTDKLSNNLASFTATDLGGYDAAAAIQCSTLAAAVAIA